MSERRFKPLFHMEMEEEDNQKEQVEIEQDNPCNEVENTYRIELERVREEITRLKSHIEALEGERSELLKEKETLRSLLEERKHTEGLLSNLTEEIVNSIGRVKESLKESLLDMVMELTKKLVLSTAIPKEDTLRKALSKLLESNIELKGQLILHLSPKDANRVESFLKSLEEKSGGSLELSIIREENLSEGEFILETPKLWIERKYEDLLEDLMEELRDEGSV